jgi:hypothetical protein
MTSDAIGLRFFTGQGTVTSTGRPSAFATVDQTDMIARLDATEDDDLDSPFFGADMVAVENASTRSFDIGIRTIGSTDVPAKEGEGEGTASPALHDAAMPGRWSHDDRTRAAFIVGGPAALR